MDPEEYENSEVSARSVYRSTAITDGNYEFNCSDPLFPINVVEYFNFIDSSGTLVAATAGTVTITADSGNGVFQELQDNSFSAATANSSTREKPNGRGRAVRLRVALSGVVASGAVGFEFSLTQSQS